MGDNSVGKLRKTKSHFIFPNFEYATENEKYFEEAFLVSTLFK